VYELRNGEEFDNGPTGLSCANFDVEPQVLELKDNEYISSISGTGKDFIKTLVMETNFYRKIKQGIKVKEDGVGANVGGEELKKKHTILMGDGE
jgi:hypothetical protein